MIECINNSLGFIPEFNKIVKSVLVSKPPERSNDILLVFFLRERRMKPHLSTHLSIISNPSFDSQ